MAVAAFHGEVKLTKLWVREVVTAVKINPLSNQPVDNGSTLAHGKAYRGLVTQPGAGP